MKKKGMRAIAAALCLVLCFALAGCGAGLGDMLTLRRCLRALSDAESVSFTFHSDAAARIGGEETPVRLDGDGVWYGEPSALLLDAEFTLGRIGSISGPVILTREDDSLVVYIGLDAAGDPLWIKTAKDSAASDVPASDASSQGLPAILALMGQGDSVSVADDENDAGLLCVSVLLPGYILAPEAEETPDDLPITIWIDKKSALPTRVLTDLAPLVRQMLDSSDSPYASLLSVESLPLEITVTGLDMAAPLELPSPERVILDLSEEAEPAPTPIPAGGTGPDVA